jgi:hypothetical protein
MTDTPASRLTTFLTLRQALPEESPVDPDMQAEAVAWLVVHARRRHTGQRVEQHADCVRLHGQLVDDLLVGVRRYMGPNRRTR